MMSSKWRSSSGHGYVCGRGRSHAMHWGGNLIKPVSTFTGVQTRG